MSFSVIVDKLDDLDSAVLPTDDLDWRVARSWARRLPNVLLISEESSMMGVELLGSAILCGCRVWGGRGWRTEVEIAVSRISELMSVAVLGRVPSMLNTETLHATEEVRLRILRINRSSQSTR